MTAFKFNPTQIDPQAEVRVDVSPAVTQRESSDADRIAAARSRAKQRTKESSAHPVYGFGYATEHYKDFGGPETSQWDADVLVCIAGILETPILKRSRFAWQPDHYDARTGTFNLSDAPPVSIQELKDAIDARIEELNLSTAAIWEWHADSREPLGGEWWRQDLETRIKKFRKVEN